jgi:hypothetical protein
MLIPSRVKTILIKTTVRSRDEERARKRRMMMIAMKMTAIMTKTIVKRKARMMLIPMREIAILMEARTEPRRSLPNIIVKDYELFLKSMASEEGDSDSNEAGK